MSKCSGHMSAYKSACKEHSDLKSFDSSLQQRTIKVIDKLTAKAETGTGVLSQHEIHIEISKHQLEVSQDVANFILEREGDVWESNALKSLVLAYFDNTHETLKIFGDVMGCVEEAENGKDYIQIAVDNFDKESAKKDVGEKKKKYEETIKYLKKFEDLGDVFDSGKLTAQIDLLKKQQESLLEKLCEAKNKLDEELCEAKKKLDEVHETNKFWNVVFGAGIALAVVASIATMGIAAGVAAPLLAVGWIRVSHYLENKIEDLKRQQEDGNKQRGIIDMIEKGTVTNKESMMTVSALVNLLKTKISFILKVVNEATGDEEDEVTTELVLKMLKEKVDKLTEQIKEVVESVDKHSTLILEAKYHVLQKINGSGKYHRG
ncbi:UPF0496 protein At3g28270 [Capsella rubella]|nr:UPF0496 protein At3g28270 [Capsella rubella]